MNQALTTALIFTRFNRVFDNLSLGQILTDSNFHESTYTRLDTVYQASILPHKQMYQEKILIRSLPR